MSSALSNDDLARIRDALAARKKIEAIKVYREATGAGLAEAKRSVEAIEAGRDVSGPALDTASNDDIDQIQAAVFAGEKIQAIKLYRTATGEGLMESKQFIDALEDELRRTDPDKFTAPAAKGCGVTILALIAMFAVLVGATMI